MRSLFFLLFCLFIASCSSQHKAIKKEREAWGFKNWKTEFKDRALCLCLLEGYENSDVQKFIVQNDKSYYSGIGIAIFDPTLKPIIRQEVEKIKQDSINSIHTAPEAAVGKKIFSHCLNFYKSKRLDSITKKEVLKWKKIKNIEEEVLKYVPTY
ncbi:MAG TPA: hypothetical protein VGQ04_16535 [Chitinophagaceae bacterium]|jgi:molybdopterin-guanine dinucleotide biosynthesis protein|nr:hypothetical protein [Chitinophagaceae bacterium]